MNLTDTTIENELEEKYAAEAATDHREPIFETRDELLKALDHAASRAIQFFVVGFALYLVAEILIAFSTGAIERAVQ